jgi:hypothetical protein
VTLFIASPTREVISAQNAKCAHHPAPSYEIACKTDMSVCCMMSIDRPVCLLSR